MSESLRGSLVDYFRRAARDRKEMQQGKGRKACWKLLKIFLTGGTGEVAKQNYFVGGFILVVY